jgi:hypothetical protein
VVVPAVLIEVIPGLGSTAQDLVERRRRVRAGSVAWVRFFMSGFFISGCVPVGVARLGRRWPSRRLAPLRRL